MDSVSSKQFLLNILEIYESKVKIRSYKKHLTVSFFLFILCLIKKKNRCDAFRNFVLFVQFKKTEKTPMEDCYLLATLLKVAINH